MVTNLDENNLVTKSNYLIEAPYKLTAGEQKVLLSLVSLISPQDDSFQIYSFKVKDLAKILDIDHKAVYKEIEKITDSLRKRDLTISKENSILKANWLSSVEYFKGDGLVELCFDPKLKPYLLELKECFTSYKFKNIVQLKSYYSIRIYQLLKQYEKLKKREFELQELRQTLGIEEKQYPKYANFKQKVLNIAHSEINEKTDIGFEFEEIKTGRKVVGVRFLIKSNKEIIATESKKEENQQDLSVEEQLKINTLKLMFPQKITEHEIRSILHIAEWDLPNVIEKYYLIKNTKNIENFVGLMIAAIKSNYSEVAVSLDENEKGSYKTKLHNFEQRTSNYTPEELEKMILENQKKKRLEAKKNKFNNFDQRTEGMTEEEIQKMLEEKQKRFK